MFAVYAALWTAVGAGVEHEEQANTFDYQPADNCQSLAKVSFAVQKEGVWIGSEYMTNMQAVFS